ncbi:MAG: biotin--[acetyl-CoA-carboxylase] ligase [Ktedonobacterales bacterium]
MRDDDDSARARDRLEAAPLDVAAVEAEIVPLRLGHPFLYFPAVASTNTTAAQLARDGAAEGTLVTTDDQTAGRGRIGRVWRSLPGQQLAVSLVLRPSFPPHFLVMASALAVAEAIDAVVAPSAETVSAEIKWPNDVLLAGRKVCGILIETSTDFAVLGIGVNVNSSLAADAALAAHATTLAEVVGRPIARETLLVALLRRLDAHYADLSGSSGGAVARQAVRDRWRARLVTLGQSVRIAQGDQPPLEGVAEGVDADGVLLLRRADGTLRAVTWGDVQS